MTATRVVVTGAAGIVGRVVLDGIDARHDVRGVDARRTSRTDRRVDRVQLRRPGAAARALAGADVVVHLADRASQSTPWRTVHHNNLRVLWNTLEAARAVGARRVVLASSNAVVGGYEDDHPYREILAGHLDGLDPSAVPLLTSDVPVRPNGAYAVGKVTAEAAGRFMADRYDLSVIALRIGTVRPGDRPDNVRHLSTLLTGRDLVHLVEQCIDAPDDVRFATFYGVSANTWRIWDISDARAIVGYEPVDDAERWRGQ
jgi:nucleoside-diphosphate-sugar epimerase